MRKPGPENYISFDGEVLKIPSEQEKDIVENAQENVEQTRQATITLQDLEPNSEYDVELTRHDYPFGTEVDFEMLFLDKAKLLDEFPERAEQIEAYFAKYDDSYREKYLEAVKDKFTGLVAGNTFKWHMMDRNGKTDWSMTDRVMDFLKENPEHLKNFRGHTVFWNRRDYLPEYLKGKPKDEIKEAVMDERLEILKRYPDIEEWDLLNEPLRREERIENGVDKNALVFDPVEDIDFFVELFKKAKEINPQARFYVNEYGVLNGNKLDEYTEFIKKLQENGAPLDGIGVQGHMNEWDFANIEQIANSLESLGQLGLPVKITEFDVSREVIANKCCQPGQDPEKARAEYLRKVMTLCYGTKFVDGFYLWGIQDKAQWRAQRHGEHVGLFDEDFNENQAGQEYFELVDREWSTKARVKTDDKGQVSFKGFPGEYKTEKVTN